MQSFFLKTLTGSIMVSTVLFSSSCNTNTSTTTANADSTMTSMDSNHAMGNLTPKGPKPDWAPDMTPEMQVVIEKLVSYGDPALVTLPATEARQQHSPADAVMDVMKDNNIPMPTPMSDTSGVDIAVHGGSIHARVYTPKGAGPFPVIVYYHGGGWVIANLDTYNASAQGMSDQTGAVVVSVAYRQAPEFKYPTAHNDSYAAYEWVLKNIASLKGDAKHVALVGESAGGNLACAVSMMARDKGAAMPVYQVLVYPIAGYDTTTESYTKNADAKPLNRPLMSWFFEKYLNSPADGKKPMISLVTANLKNLPPTTVITAQYDPLQSEGVMLADKLKEAGVTVNSKTFAGVTHEFFGMATVLPQAKDAQALAASDLKGAFNK